MLGRTRGSVVLALGLGLAVPAAAERPIRLDAAIAQARERNPLLALARAEQEQADAATITARQFLNPSLLGAAGPLRGRNSSIDEGTAFRLQLSQPFQTPFLRGARRRAAESGLDAARASARAADADLVAGVKSAFSQVLLAQGLLELSQEQLALLSRVREGIERKVRVGEGPGLDLARAETEVLNARRDRAEAKVAVTQAKLELGTVIGEPDPQELAIDGGLPLIELPSRDDLRLRLADGNPRIEAARRDVERARHQLSLEKHKRLDGLGFEAEWEREPETDKVYLGLRVPLPLWNRRRGEIAEAIASVRRAEALLAGRELALGRELGSLYNRYLLAQEQVQIIEQGLLQEANRALRGAEVAYRSGERGILEYLDAQRTLRDIRLDQLTERGEMERAGIEIERLAGSTR
ncbi:MAG: TolC family protein [Deltaproteobacteria bacterium]|nr:TolC family protein [Deltaproteobacteria bacterium]